MKPGRGGKKNTIRIVISSQIMHPRPAIFIVPAKEQQIIVVYFNLVC